MDTENYDLAQALTAVPSDRRPPQSPILWHVRSASNLQSREWGQNEEFTYPVEGSGELGAAGGEMKTMEVMKGVSAQPEGMLARGWNSAMNFVEA